MKSKSKKEVEAEVVDEARNCKHYSKPYGYCICEKSPHFSHVCHKCRCYEEDSKEVVDATPCVHCDGEGFCTNKEMQGGGFKCCRCTEYKPTTALAVAEAEICKWMQGGKCGNAEGPKGFDCIGLRSCRFGRSNKAKEMPTTIQVRRHKHLVNLPVEQALTQQYERVSRVSNAALREIVIFGAMIDRIDQALTASRFNPDGSGTSLKSWLAEKCPDIDYNTARDYKRTMKNFVAYMKLKEDTPLLEMMNVDCYEDAKKEALRRNVLDTISHMTKYKLRQITDKKDKPGNTQATGRKELTAVERAARAASDANELVGSLHAFVFSGTSLSLLTEAELSSFAHELKVCASRVEEEISKK